MSYDIVFCNSKGESTLGSDGKMYIDRRLSMSNIRLRVKEYRARYEKNFPHLSKEWTHFYYKGLLHTI